MIESEASSDLKRLFNLNYIINYIISNKYIIFLGKQLRLNTFLICSFIRSGISSYSFFVYLLGLFTFLAYLYCPFVCLHSHKSIYTSKWVLTRSRMKSLLTVQA